MAYDDHGAVAEALRERGFAVLPGFLDPDQTAEARALVAGLVARIPNPRFSVEEPRELDPPAEGLRVLLTRNGLLLDRLLLHHDSLRERVLRRELVSGLREALGPAMRLEREGAMVTDRSRPFFRWHTHIDGVDEGARGAAGVWPPKARVERVIVLLYLHDLDDDAGPLLIHPRREGDATPPPHDVRDATWPDQVVVNARAGTAVIVEQCTWHAVPTMRRDGLRAFIAGYFCAGGASRPEWTDPLVGGLI